MRKQRRKPRLHKNWRCPGCGNVYRGPLPVLEAVCPKVLQHKSRATVAMKPVEEEV